MRQTLFHIPAELFGVPTLGCGWLLGLWVIVAFFFAWGAYRHDGMWPALFSLGIYLLLGSVVLGFALPHLEEQIIDGAAVRNLGLPVRGYGVAMFLAVSAGVALAIYRGERRGLDTERVTSLAVWLFVAGLFGARLFFLVQHRDEFAGVTWQEGLGKAINIAEGGLVVYGSLIGALLAYTVFVIRHRLPPLVIADLLAPSMLLGLAIGRMGCLMNGCCYGGPCTYEWGVRFPPESAPFGEQLERGLQHGVYWSVVAANPGVGGRDADQGQRICIQYVDPDGPAARAGLTSGVQLSLDDAHALAVAEPYQDVTVTDLAGPLNGVYEWKAGLVPRRSFPTHPTQIYSSLNAFLLCGLVLAISPFVKRDGALLAITLMTYPVTRFLLEIVRIDEPALNQFGWTISQTVSFLIFAVGAGLAFYVCRQPEGKLHARVVAS